MTGVRFIFGILFSAISFFASSGPTDPIPNTIQWKAFGDALWLLGRYTEAKLFTEPDVQLIKLRNSTDTFFPFFPGVSIQTPQVVSVPRSNHEYLVKLHINARLRKNGVHNYKDVFVTVKVSLNDQQGSRSIGSVQPTISARSTQTTSSVINRDPLITNIKELLLLVDDSRVTMPEGGDSVLLRKSQSGLRDPDYGDRSYAALREIVNLRSSSDKASTALPKLITFTDDAETIEELSIQPPSQSIDSTSGKTFVGTTTMVPEVVPIRLDGVVNYVLISRTRSDEIELGSTLHSNPYSWREQDLDIDQNIFIHTNNINFSWPNPANMRKTKYVFSLLKPHKNSRRKLCRLSFLDKQ